MEYLNALENLIQSSHISTQITMQNVSPWGKFTFALNVGVQYAVDNNYPYILFQSIEITCSPNTIDRMMSLFVDEHTSVVGSELAGHVFTVGINQLRGRTCPWNTLAIWRTSHLGLIGFPLIGNGTSSIEGGVEEVSCLSLLMMIRPDDQRLKYI
jgi:hypothetical protein